MTTMHWLIAEETLRAIRAARSDVRPGAEERAAFRAIEVGAAKGDGSPPNLAVVGDTAEIRVEGVLVESMDFWLWLLGYDQTVYSDIQRSLAMAIGDPEITSIRLYVDSPGGTVDGLFETLAALEDARGRKPITVAAENAFSAAYMIAAVAGPIEARNRASSFGSVGVAASYYVDEDAVEITNTESPDKRPDVSTEQGRAVVRSYLDALFEIFVGAIAKGRGTDAKSVVENFGRGALLVAEDAKRRGMIDSIAAPPLRVVHGAAAVAAERPPPTPDPGHGDRTMSMDLRTLRADHPELFDQVVQVGVAQERDRVTAHLTMGEASRDLATAHAAIRDGSGMTLEMHSRYLSASMRLSEQNARQSDSDSVGEVVEGATAPEAESGDLGDQVVAVMRAGRGSKED